MPHLPALDGLRGLALLGVLFFHAGGALKGGYLGVDLFFVLSGFLITSLLLAEHRKTGRIALWPFWVRRARRLFPALLSLMPAIALYARYYAKPVELAGLRADALATMAYVANWRAIFSHKSYWELFASPSPLEHCWSLSIEEQFYVVWPLAVALLLRRGSARSIRMLALVLTGLSVTAMIVLFDPERTSRVYLGTDTRAASILAGAALATIISPSTTFAPGTVKKLDVLGILCAAGLGVAWWRLEGSSRFLYRGGFWLTELAALVLIACAVSGPRSIVARALAARPLAMLGTISYGVYLWHWPVNVFVSSQRFHWLPARGFWLHVIQFAITFVISIVSYRFLERPIRMRGLPFGRPVVMVPAAVAVAVLLVVRATNARAMPTQALANRETGIATGAGLEPVFEPARFRVMLLGDSTANSLGWGLRGVHQPGLAVENLGRDGCTMLADSLCGGPQWAQEIAQVKPDATLVFVGGAFLHGLTLENDWRKSCHPGWDAKFEGNMIRRLGELAAAHLGRVWAVTIPYPLDVYDNATFRHEVDCINVSIRKSAAAVPGIEVLDLFERLCPKGVCLRESDGVEIRPDGVHYTIDGINSVARSILEEIQRAPIKE